MMLEFNGRLLLVLGIFFSLRNVITNEIGSGLDPFHEAQSSKSEDATANVTGILAAFATVTNSVNASVSHILTATQDEVSEDNTAKIQLFGKLCKALQDTNDSMSMASAMDEFLHSLDSLTSSGIPSNITKLKNHKNVLKTALKTISNGADQTEKPAANINVGNFITPDMVTSIADGLGSLTACVNNIADLFTKVIEKQMHADAQAAKVNASAITAVRSLATTFNTFTSSTTESCRLVVQTGQSVTDNILASFSPTLQDTGSYNSDDISNLNNYIQKLKLLDSSHAQTVIHNFEIVQARVFEMLTTRTQQVAVTLYNATKSIIYADSSSTSPHTSKCSSKYIAQLMEPSVQVSRLSSCLSPETETLFNYNLMLTPLMLQLQNDASAFGPERIKACSRPNGPCSAAYFSAYEGLGVQIEAQLKNLNSIMNNELRFLQGRVETCISAITADIDDNIKTVKNDFRTCLMTGE